MAEVPPAGHLAAGVLFVADAGARILRLRIASGAVGARIGVVDAMVVNAWSDLASAVTPLRLGGEPARFGGLRLAGVPPGRALGTLALELVTTLPATAAVGGLLGVVYGARWWQDAGARLLPPVGWLATLVTVVVLTVVVRRLVPGRPVLASAAPPALPGATAVAALASCSVVNVACRVALLPVLAWSSGALTDPGVLLLGSFVLIYGQLLSPVPAGAGLLDAFALAGGAGPMSGALLVAWRLYATVLPAGCGGLAILARRDALGVGVRRLRGLGRGSLLRRRLVPVEEAAEDRTPVALQRGLAPARAEPPT